jgi:hypothetical protein
MQPIKQKIDSLNKKNNQSSRSTSPKHYYNSKTNLFYNFFSQPYTSKWEWGMQEFVWWYE